MLKKLFLGFIALCFILFGSLILMMGYVFNNPEKVFDAFSSMTDKFISAQPYEENEEFFIQGLDKLHISTDRVDVNLHIYSGATLKVSLHGKVPRFDSGPYILQIPDKNALQVELHEPLASQWVQFNVNGKEYTQESDSKLEADIYVPDTYKKTVTIESRSGSVTLNLPRESVYETDLKSVAGKIQNDSEMKKISDIKPEDIGRIEVSTEKGAITVKAL